MQQNDWYLKVMVTLLVIGVWVLILKPVLAPRPSVAAGTQAELVAAKVVRAERFDVVDDQGRVRGQLKTQPHGGVRLVLRDQDEKLRACLELWSDGTPHLTLYHRREDGVAEIRAYMYINRSGTPYVKVCSGEKSVCSGTLQVTGGGTPVLRLERQDMKTAATLVAGKHGADLQLESDTGGGRATLEVDSNGKPGLTLRESSMRRAVLGSTRLTDVGTVPVSSLLLLDKQGKVIWKAPPD